MLTVEIGKNYVGLKVENNESDRIIIKYLFPLEPPKGNANCPRRNGFFAHPDPKICNVFYNCIEGEFTELPCTAGLHFDEYSGTCVWPDAAGRQGCVEGSRKFMLLLAYQAFTQHKI